MMTAHTKVIDRAFLDRLKDIQLMLVLYVHGRLTLDARQEQTMRTLFKSFCKHWNISPVHKDFGWSRPGLAKLIRGAIGQTRNLIKQDYEFDIEYALAIADLEDCTHTFLLLKKP